MVGVNVDEREGVSFTLRVPLFWLYFTLRQFKSLFFFKNVVREREMIKISDSPLSIMSSTLYQTLIKPWRIFNIHSFIFIGNQQYFCLWPFIK